MLLRLHQVLFCVRRASRSAAERVRVIGSVDIGDGHVVEFIAGLAFSSNLHLFGVNLVLRSELLLDKRPFDFQMYAHYDDGSETSLSMAVS